MKIRVCVTARALFLCLKFVHFFRILCNLSFNFCFIFLPTFNNFGLIFFQSQSKTWLTINFTTYFLTKFTTVSTNFPNISIGFSFRGASGFCLSYQICDLRKIIWWFHFFICEKFFFEEKSYLKWEENKEVAAFRKYFKRNSRECNTYQHVHFFSQKYHIYSETLMRRFIRSLKIK